MTTILTQDYGRTVAPYFPGSLKDLLDHPKVKVNVMFPLISSGGHSCVLGMAYYGTYNDYRCRPGAKNQLKTNLEFLEDRTDNVTPKITSYLVSPNDVELKNGIVYFSECIVRVQTCTTDEIKDSTKMNEKFKKRWDLLTRLELNPEKYRGG
jgi:hypothetical protein